MDGEIASDGGCARCEREGIVLLDGVLCERCHGKVWASYEDSITRFGLYRVSEGEDGGGLVAAGVADGDRAILAWLDGPTSAEVYDGLEGFQRTYQARENLRITYF